MRTATILIIILLTFVIGCTGKNQRIDPNEFLQQFQTSLEEQGLKVETMEPPSSVDMQGLIPYQFSISYNGEEKDTVFIFFTDSIEQARQALAEANFMISTLTKVGEYQQDNVIIIQFAHDGNLDKYRSQIYTAISSDEE
ncbi:hypothetical protein J2W91_004091 [Paenibacillus amylolyticus]|uniref:Lipoprotein n=1 Tax=Paenibacillus amylolyticus TaxID=1451 RepID=A0AAP5H3F4_PAEAM|nr:hypothetical protein [Paenibacillus amylolyticus]MDR6725589.1 hypothetical protein [Paenibacillus amylolyticus]